MTGRTPQYREASSAVLGVASPFLFATVPMLFRILQCISADSLQSLPAASLFKAANPKGVVLAAPAGLGGPLGLSLAMRCSFELPPEMPFVSERPTVTDRASLVRFAVWAAMRNMLRATCLSLALELLCPSCLRMPPPYGSRRRRALVSVSGFRLQEDAHVVVGDSQDDFALALILHRLFKRVCWVPRAG